MFAPMAGGLTADDKKKNSQKLQLVTSEWEKNDRSKYALWMHMKLKPRLFLVLAYGIKLTSESVWVFYILFDTIKNHMGKLKKCSFAHFLSKMKSIHLGLFNLCYVSPEKTWAALL